MSQVLIITLKIKCKHKAVCAACLFLISPSAHTPHSLFGTASQSRQPRRETSLINRPSREIISLDRKIKATNQLLSVQSGGWESHLKTGVGEERKKAFGEDSKAESKVKIQMARN